MKVTFKGDFPYRINERPPRKGRKKRERREEYQELIQLLHYQSLPLLKDTIVEILLNDTNQPVSNIPNIKNEFQDTEALILSFPIQEDQQRVIYPPISRFLPFLTIETSTHTQGRTY